MKGDAAGQIAAPHGDVWTPALAEAYASRIGAIIAQHIHNVSAIKGARKVISPADLEAMNINLVGGDPYGGAATMDQFFIWRPFTDIVNHKTHVKNLYHIGPSTHPGRGPGGGSGVLLARDL